MKHSLACLLCLLFVLVAQSAQGDEATIRKRFAERAGGNADQVSRTSIPGLYEVFSDGEIYYTDAKVSVLINGDMMDLKTHRSITAARRDALSHFAFSELPLQQAIKRVRGSGKASLAVFEDPYCPTCKRLEAELDKLRDVTLYVFLYPVLSMESHEMAHRFWCSPDRSAAWKTWMTSGNEPPPMTQDCDISPVEKNLALGARLKIVGTPTLIFPDGSRVSAGLKAKEIERRIGGAQP